MLTGDARTGLPFVLNSVKPQLSTRVFLPVKDDEILALDITFPPNGIHNITMPNYMLLHGVNGESKEPYVQDVVLRRTQAGSTVVVMVSRGLMDLPLRGPNIFHGARLTDAHEAALALRRVLGPEQILVGIGYSMGAIVLNNYVATYGTDCALDAAFSISGAMDCREQITNLRLQRLWQPMIAKYMKESQYLVKWFERLRRRLSPQQLVAMMRSTSVVEIDEYTAVAYNGFESVESYYGAMSAFGDITTELNGESTEMIAQLSSRAWNISIPLCILHAFDDQISTWRTIVGNSGWRHPHQLAN
jgi:predicted alpha/beta-fold hydrolase